MADWQGNKANELELYLVVQYLHDALLQWHLGLSGLRLFRFASVFTEYGVPDRRCKSCGDLRICFGYGSIYLSQPVITEIWSSTFAEVLPTLKIGVYEATKNCDYIRSNNQIINHSLYFMGGWGFAG